VNTLARARLISCVLSGSALTGGCAVAQTGAPAAAAEPQSTATEVAAYSFSRGKGVSAEARAALDAARELLGKWRAERRVLDIVESRDPLEGGRRVCARFASAAEAVRGLKELRALAPGVDQFNVVMEPCARVRGQGEPQ